MKSPSIIKWEQAVKNPQKSYQEFFKREERFLKDRMPKGLTVLDIGCGDGRVLGLLSVLSKKSCGNR
jgi:cyclopropane fatty-acyl-phospholipid synthase-like methyltransferase